MCVIKRVGGEMVGKVVNCRHLCSGGWLESCGMISYHLNDIDKKHEYETDTSYITINMISLSFELSLSFWKGKTHFVYGQQFMHSQSRLGRYRAWIWQQSDTCSYCLSTCTWSSQHVNNFTDSESSVLMADSYPLSKLWSVLLVDGHPKCLASSAEVTLLLNLENHPETCILLIECYPKATCNIWEACIAFFPSWK